MEDFGKAKLDFFKTFLELPHGIPEEQTFSRLFTRIHPTELAACLGKWLEEVREVGGGEINIDGKAICGSACKRKGKKAAHLVSAWVGAQNLVLGQVATEEKSNEITAIPELLDAMGCQREIAKKIREKRADYVLSLKENQPETYREVKDYFEKDHGRIEWRGRC
jgi:hypothetical protein